MTQEFQSPQMQVQGQTMGGQQMGQMGNRLPPQRRQALDAVGQAIQVCEWCADQCIQEANPNMIECIRLCEDVAELGEATLALASRDSRYAAQVVQTFQGAVQACAQECGRHPHAHCQDCAETLDRTLQQIETLAQGNQFAQ